MRRFLISIAFVLTSGVAACGGDSAGGELNSDAGLHAFMDAIAIDFAGVLADLAPANGAVTVKDGATVCPDGGDATWTDGAVGTGTLSLTECGMRGVQVTGTLSGFLEFSPDGVDAQLAGGPVSVAGSFSGELNLRQLIFQANDPPTTATTYWEVRATDPNNRMLCAWSGGSGCGPTPPL